MERVYNLLSAVFYIVVFAGIGYAVGYLHGHSNGQSDSKTKAEGR